MSNVNSLSNSQVGQKCVPKTNSDCKLKFVRQFNRTKRLPVQSSSGCILSCCRSCTFCQMSRAPTKERVKSRCIKECCSKSGCRGQATKVFLEKWLDLGANPRVVSILKEGYTLLFKIRSPLTRSPVVLRGYANPVKNQKWFQF